MINNQDPLISIGYVEARIGTPSKMKTLLCIGEDALIAQTIYRSCSSFWCVCELVDLYMDILKRFLFVLISFSKEEIQFD